MSRHRPVLHTHTLSRQQTEQGCKVSGDSEQSNRDLACCWDSCVTFEPLCPREASVCSLRAGQDNFRCARRSGDGRWQAHLDTLVLHELHTGASVFSSAPISPEQRGRTNLERMQQHADLAWLFGGAALPLALLAERAGTTTANAGSIHHTQACIGFSTLLMRDQLLVGRAPQRAVGLERKVLAGETARFPGQAHLRRSRARGRSRVR